MKSIDKENKEAQKEAGQEAKVQGIELRNIQPASETKMLEKEIDSVALANRQRSPLFDRTLSDLNVQKYHLKKSQRPRLLYLHWISYSFISNCDYFSS